MKILAIESSCDETAVAIVEDGRKIISNEVYSQIDIHRLYGGVVPEIASRNHLEKISKIVDSALEHANLSLSDIDCFAVTYGPGLVGALLVGISYAKALSYVTKKPLIPVNHMEGHIASVYLSNPEVEPPFLCIVVSGGHTYLAVVKSYTDIEVIGTTRDDAVGEAYDKVARTLGLSYPGGPEIDRLAQKGNPHAIYFKRSYLNDSKEENFDFSFSGIKSGVLNYLHNAQQRGENVKPEDVAASFQESVLEVLIHKGLLAAKKYGMEKIVIAGGVAANSKLRSMISGYKELKFENGDDFSDCRFEIYYPDIKLCTDNAAMIASQAFFRRDSQKEIHDILELNAIPNLDL